MQRSIFITGAGSGIGRAIAIYFAQRGWTVGIGDIDMAGMAETARLAGSPRLSRHHLDVRQAAAWRKALRAFAGESRGCIDVVVNNAGIGIGGSLIDLSDDDVDQMIDVNFRGSLIGARESFPYLVCAGRGSCLLNVASASAIYGSAGLAVYSSTKFAIRGLTEALDLEWENQGIRCRSLMPAFVDTPMLAQQAEAASSDSKRDRVLAAGLEFTPVESVAEAAWKAIHGSKLHVPVGKSAKQLKLAARWAPSLLRWRLRALLSARLGKSGAPHAGSGRRTGAGQFRNLAADAGANGGGHYDLQTK